MSSNTSTEERRVTEAPDQNRAEEKSSSGISAAQVIGSALAASSAAFAASFLGVAGTVIGAAVVSVVATVGSAMYTTSLQKGSSAARRAARTVREQQFRPVMNRHGNVVGMEPVTQRLPLQRREQPASGASQDPESTRRITEQHGSVRRTESVGWRERLAGLDWKRVLLAAAAVLLLTILIITSIEGVTHRQFGGGRGTTLGAVTGTNPSPAKNHDQQRHHQQKSTTSTTPSAQPSGAASSSQPSAQPSSTPSSQPSHQATPTAISSPNSGSTPSSQPTSAPTSAAPTSGSTP